MTVRDVEVKSERIRQDWRTCPVCGHPDFVIEERQMVFGVQQVRLVVDDDGALTSYLWGTTEVFYEEVEPTSLGIDLL